MLSDKLKDFFKDVPLDTILKEETINAVSVGGIPSIALTQALHQLTKASEQTEEAIEGFTKRVELLQFDPITKHLIPPATVVGDTSEGFTPDREYGWYRKFEKINKRGK